MSTTVGMVLVTANYKPQTPAAASQTLKIMHVTNSMAVGGTEKVVLKLATTLTDGFQHHVCCIRDFDQDLVSRWLQPEQFSGLHLPESRFAIFVPRLLRAIRSCAPDIVHSRNWGAIEAVFAARLARVPIVIHSEHGYDVDGLQEIPLRQRLVRRMAYSTADTIFTVSRELREFHATLTGIRRERIRVLYNGVDTARFAPKPEAKERIRAEHGIAHDEFLVGAVGRMAAIKDYQTLIRAAALLCARGLKFRLMLVGDGPELDNLLAQAEALPRLRPRLLPLGQRDDIGELLNAMDVFVQTSLREGMSNTILEATSSGLPVVVTRVGGNPELVEEGKTGWLFMPGDAEHLAKILQELATNATLRDRAGQRARRRAESLFSNQRMLENYRELYLELANRRGAFQVTQKAKAKPYLGSRLG